MKKFLFLLLSMAVLSASAGVTKSAIQKNVAKYSNKAKTEMVSKFKVSHEVKATPVLKAPVTEQPAGEVKTYQRSGECLAVDGDYVEHLTQDGFIDLIFAENNIVWFKNIFYKVNENFGDSYVYGTLSEDGTKIAEAMAKTKELPVAGGKLTYDDKHNPIVPALIIEVKDGKPTFVDKIAF